MPWSRSASATRLTRPMVRARNNCWPKPTGGCTGSRIPTTPPGELRIPSRVRPAPALPDLGRASSLQGADREFGAFAQLFERGLDRLGERLAMMLIGQGDHPGGLFGKVAGNLEQYDDRVSVQLPQRSGISQPFQLLEFG